jgi:hypothetical protein
VQILKILLYPTVSYCLTQANSVYSSGTGIINNQDPLFVDAANGDFRVHLGSPCIDMGDGATGNSANTTTSDLAGNTRFNGVIDMGAYESTGAVLPVELLYFYGKKAENGVLLSWETATEINNDYFDVEWSTDGISFEKIGQVKGAGTTMENQSYEFLHQNPVTGNNYYRLKQVDFDGKFEYSNIVMVNYQLSTVDYPLNIYPNPVRYSLTIENGQGTAIIYNALGQLIQQVNIDASKLQLDVSELPQGIYTIHIRKTNGENVTKQFVK